MAITRISRPEDSKGYASYTLTDPDGITSEHFVYEDQFYKYSWYDGGRKNELFHVGGGNPFNTETKYQYDFGSYVLTPKNDFKAWLHMWGGGGGNYNSGNDQSRGGGGGFTQGLIQFKTGIPYTLTVGQAGRLGYSDVTTHGGGGGTPNSNGGQGGGLSGLFYNTNHYGKNVWAYSPPVTQANALLIAGGGGGNGVHNTGTHYGTGGGGGGWQGLPGNATTGGGQKSGGYAASYTANIQHTMGVALHGGRGDNESHCGGGGGGWFGGGGGAYIGSDPSRHEGGSGGSGHHAYSSTIHGQPNNGLAKYVLAANTETSPSSFNQPRQYSANVKNPLAFRSSNPTYGEYDGLYAGKGGYGNTENTGRSSALHGKIIITLAKDIVPPSWSTKIGNTETNSGEWSIEDGY